MNLGIFFHRDKIMSHNYTCRLRNWVHIVYPNPEDITIVVNSSVIFYFDELYRRRCPPLHHLFLCRTDYSRFVYAKKCDFVCRYQSKTIV
jgi:hypothetical protein